jgi:hypothetical protein
MRRWLGVKQKTRAAAVARWLVAGGRLQCAYYYHYFAICLLTLMEVFHPIRAPTGWVKVGGLIGGKPNHIIIFHYYIDLKEKA